MQNFFRDLTSMQYFGLNIIHQIGLSQLGVGLNNIMNVKVTCSILISPYNVHRICKTRYALEVEVTEIRPCSAHIL
jgi:hypothetical protein